MQNRKKQKRDAPHIKQSRANGTSFYILKFIIFIIASFPMKEMDWV
jgi:hypothetical protein